MEDEQSTDVAVQETDLSGINDINFDEDDSTDTSEATTEEQSEEKADTSEEKSTEEVEESTDESETTEEEETDDKVEESEEDKLKAFKREQYERRKQEKQQRELSIQEQQEKYLNEAEDNRDLALRQLQIDAYTNKVDSNTNKLTNGYERALKDFDILQSSDPVIKQAVDEAIDAFQAMNVRLDAYGNPIEVSGDLYQYLQSKADSISKLTGIGARQQEKDKSREKSKTFTPPSTSPKKSNDPLMDALLTD